MKDKLYLKAVVEAKDFDKEMEKLGYPLCCYYLPCFKHEDYGAYVSFSLTDEAIKNDYDIIAYEKETGYYTDEFINAIEAQIAMRKDLRTWVNDDEVLVHYNW